MDVIKEEMFGVKVGEMIFHSAPCRYSSSLTPNLITSGCQATERESQENQKKKKSVMLYVIMVYLHVLCSHWETCVFGLHLVKNLSGIWSNSDACVELLTLWRWQLVNNHIIKDQREKILWFGSDLIPHKQPGGNCPLYDTNSINTCRWNTNTLRIRSNIHCMKTAFVEWIMGLN